MTVATIGTGCTGGAADDEHAPTTQIHHAKRMRP